MDRLTSIDASFLAQERDGSHMHIGSVLIFDGDTPAKDELADYISRGCTWCRATATSSRSPASRWAGRFGSRTPGSTSATTCATRRSRRRAASSSCDCWSRGSSPSGSTAQAAVGAVVDRGLRGGLRDREQGSPLRGGRRVRRGPHHRAVRRLQGGHRRAAARDGMDPGARAQRAQVVAKGAVDLVAAPMGLARRARTSSRAPAERRRARARWRPGSARSRGAR